MGKELSDQNITTDKESHYIIIFEKVQFISKICNSPLASSNNTVLKYIKQKPRELQGITEKNPPSQWEVLIYLPLQLPDQEDKIKKI